MHPHEIAGHVLDLATSTYKRTPSKRVVGDILHHQDPKVQAVLAGHRIMALGNLSGHAGGSAGADEIYHRLENSPHPEVTRALASNPYVRIETHYKLATEHPDPWTNASVHMGVQKRQSSSREFWHVGSAGLKKWSEKITDLAGKHGWRLGSKDGLASENLTFVHPKHPGHGLRVEAPSHWASGSEKGLFIHMGVPAQKKQYASDLKVDQHGWHTGHGPELEQHLVDFHGRVNESKGPLVSDYRSVLVRHGWHREPGTKHRRWFLHPDLVFHAVELQQTDSGQWGWYHFNPRKGASIRGETPEHLDNYLAALHSAGGDIVGRLKGGQA